MYFKKLDIEWPTTNLTSELCQGDFLVAYGPLHYYTMRNLFGLEKWQASLQPDMVQWTEVSAGELLMPHRDHGVSSVINFYVKVNKMSTLFFEPRPSATPSKLKGQEVAYLYTLDQLSIADKFVAQEGDAIALNVTQVHGVLAHKGSEGRKFVQFLWKNLTYEDLLERLRLNVA